MEDGSHQPRPDVGWRAVAAADEFLLPLTRAVEQIPSERHRWVLQARYGLGGSIRLTLAEVGDHFGFTRERARQVQKQAVTKLCSAAKQGKEPAAPAAAQAARQLLGSYSDEELAALFQQAGLSYPLDLTLLCLRLAGEGPKPAADRIKRLVEAKARTKEDRAAAPLERFLAQTLWSPTIAWESMAWPQVAARQLPGSDISGSFRSRKTGRQVPYESGLERRFFERLEKSPQVLDYLPQPLSLEYQCRGVRRQYFPDLLLRLRDDRSILVEIKPLDRCAVAPNLAKWAAAYHFCEANGLGLLVGDGRHGAARALLLDPDPGLLARMKGGHVATSGVTAGE